MMGLRQLMAAELIFQTRPLAMSLKHALVQDVAYQSLLRSRQKAAP